MTLHTFDYVKPDTRLVRFYAHGPLPENAAVLNPGVLRPGSDSETPWKGPFLRTNHLTGESISMSASRQNRPHLPSKQVCPLCPPLQQPLHEEIVSEIPLVNFEYEYVVFENLFPALWAGNETGHCEVILYSKNHETHLANFTPAQIEGLIAVWQDRSRALGALPFVDSVYIFENRGAEIGVTLHHPHGQIYAFSQTPPRLKAQLDFAERYYNQNMSCIICDVAKDHSKTKDLLLFDGSHIVAFMPQAPRFPYEINITTLAHRTHIQDLNQAEVKELAALLRALVSAYDKLFGFSLPYIMQHHQCPSQANHHASYHWNIQITPFHRSAEKLKFLAGAETGMGFFINDSLPEEKIKELRQVFETPFTGEQS